MYLIDSDVFIDAKNRHYAFDIVPAFWDWLVQAHQAGIVFTVQRVADEVLAGGDELASWMKAQPPSFRLAVGPDDHVALAAVVSWVNAAGYTSAAVSTFLAAGDYFLVAQAISLGYTVVTQETSDPVSKKRVKIPDACKAMQVPWMTPFKMLSTENARFVL